MKEEIRGECRKENVKIWGTHECLKQESERELNFEVENTGNSKKSLLNLMSEATWLEQTIRHCCDFTVLMLYDSTVLYF